MGVCGQLGNVCSETRAFLQFLKDIQYDHRQRPTGDDISVPTVITVSILIGSIRRVSEVSMVCVYTHSSL
jgi:hypothetical protein